ncbi:MAG: hypothetical protein RL757_321 [Bacteroidota bacterium]|jgi:tetratricopeptide (TPR) repeat protein
MKKFVAPFAFLLIFMSFVSPVFGQKTKTETKIAAPAPTDIHKLAFETAMKHRDLSTAIIAANYIIALEGDKSAYLDSVAYLYSVARQTTSCQLVCDRILVNTPEKIDILELKARCLTVENKIFEAIAIYEMLFKKTSDIGFGYTLAKLQLAGKRLAEALVTTNTLLKIPLNPQQPKQAIEPVGDKGETQTVGITAAMQNLRGLIVYQLDPTKNQAEAGKCFEEALKLEPNYEVAKQNKILLAAATSEKKQ